MTNDLLLAADASNCDLPLAFISSLESVEQTTLMQKHSEGVSDSAFDCFLSDLTRSSVLKIHSHPSTVSRGIPQGSIFGPLYFIIYGPTGPRVLKKSDFGCKFSLAYVIWDIESV